MPWAWRNLASSIMSTNFALDWFPTTVPASEVNIDSDDELGELFRRNKEWAGLTTQAHPDLFPTLAKTQSPKILWIGCSDSRVPETEICNAKPGDFFVHRNIANVIRPDDVSINSVLQYAVEALQVEHIIVCGHYGCGGVKAAMDPPDLDHVNDWITPIAQLYHEHKDELCNTDEEYAWRTMVHHNVRNSVDVIKRHPSVEKALSAEKPNLKIHSWVYDIATGLIIKSEPSVCKPSIV